MSHPVPHVGPLAINMNQPGSFVHWSIFDVSVANLVLIAVMVAIFGAALLIPFPRGHGKDLAGVDGDPADGDAGAASPARSAVPARPNCARTC